MLVFRITHKLYSNELYATGFDGRWNTAGQKVVYCAESIPLAFLENLVRRQGVGFNDDFRIMMIYIPDELTITLLEPGSLNDSWRDFRNYSQCQSIGNKWYDEGATPILKVPSAVMPEAFNFVLNASHIDFRKIKLIESTNLVPDERIEDILKKYPKK